MHTTRMPVDSLELGLWMIVSHCMGAENQTQVCTKQQALLPGEPSLQPHPSYLSNVESEAQRRERTHARMTWYGSICGSQISFSQPQS